MKNRNMLNINIKFLNLCHLYYSVDYSIIINLIHAKQCIKKRSFFFIFHEYLWKNKALLIRN